MYVAYDSKSEKVLILKDDWGESLYKWVNCSFWETYTQTTPWELFVCESLPVLAHALVEEASRGAIGVWANWDDELEDKIEKLNHVKMVYLDEQGGLDFFQSHDIDVEFYNEADL